MDFPQNKMLEKQNKIPSPCVLIWNPDSTDHRSDFLLVTQYLTHINSCYLHIYTSVSAAVHESSVCVCVCVFWWYSVHSCVASLDDLTRKTNKTSAAQWVGLHTMSPPTEIWLFSEFWASEDLKATYWWIHQSHEGSEVYIYMLLL